MTTRHDWLDKHIIEQANYYGISPKDKADLFAGAAEFDEMLTAGVVEEPRRSNADRMAQEQLQDKWDRLGGLHMP